jgi:hypothetical protein
MTEENAKKIKDKFLGMRMKKKKNKITLYSNFFTISIDFLKWLFCKKD